MYDVIVIGGGPVGSYVAYRLAGMGYDVMVLDKKEKLGGSVCCAGIISQRCVSSFAIDHNLVLRQVSSAQLFSPSGKLIKLVRKETQACIVDRTAFDMAIVSRARDAGAQYLLNSPVKRIEVGSTGVNVELTRQGEQLNFEARAVVIAAGFGSRLTERVGLGKISDIVAGAQAEVETIGVDEVEVYFGQEVAPGFFAWLVPTEPGRALVGLLSRRSPGHHLKKLLSALLTQGKLVSDAVEMSYRGISLKPLPRTYSRRLVAVGDAAGQVKPTTGGGIYYGLLCADMAADTLHRTLDDDDLSAKSLAGYEQDWKKKIGRDLMIGYWARKIFERLSDKRIDRIFNIIKSNGIDEALLKAEDLSFDGHGEVILRLLRYQVLSKAIKMMRVPFRISV